MEKILEHEGIVTRVGAVGLTVQITQQAACGGCAARNFCASTESKEKEIHVADVTGHFSLGERVMVSLERILGFKAICLGYLMPFLLSLTALLVVYGTTDNELAGGLSAIVVLVPYFLILKWMNRKINKDFRFSVRKIDL